MCQQLKKIVNSFCSIGRLFRHLFYKRPLLSAAFCGVLLTLGFAPFSLWPLGLLALAGLLSLVLRAEKVQQVLLLGFIFGVVHHFTALHWLVHSFYVTLGSLWLAVLVGGLCVLLLSAYFALYIMAVCWGVYKLKSYIKSWLVPLIFALLWVLAEQVRGMLTPTFAWNFVAYQWAYVDNLLQAVPYVGIMGLSFIFAAVAGCLLHWRTALAGLSVMFIMYSWGGYVLNKHPENDILTAVDNKLHMRLVAGNISQFDKWKPELFQKNIQHYISESAGIKADVIVWPETSITTWLGHRPALRKYIMEQLPSQQFIAGAPYKKDGRYYNSLYVLGKNGQIAHRYDKRFLVPFGEYFPFREYFPPFFERFLQNQGEYTSGVKSNDTLAVRGKSLEPLICGEIVLPHIKDVLLTDSRVILNITNDAWFGRTIGPAQHLAISKVKAAHLGKTVVRVSNGGGVSVIDAYGRMLTHHLQKLDVYL